MGTWVHPWFLVGSVFLVILFFGLFFRSVSGVHNAASVSGLSILDCPLVFSSVYTAIVGLRILFAQVSQITINKK